MQIGPTRLIQNDAATANYNSEEKLCKEFRDLDWDNNREIEEAMAEVKDDKNETKDSQEKNKRLKKEKMH